MAELERREAFTDGSYVERLPCRGCGKIIELWFNGGELDYKKCCGYWYALEHGPIYLIVQDDADTPAS
jgi:hypothetical protein